VGLDPANCNFARELTAGLPVQVVTADRREFLRRYSGDKITALYLDSMDTTVEGHEQCNLEEARLALPHLAEDAVILINSRLTRSTRL
jgi:hypothetical protein